MSGEMSGVAGARVPQGEDAAAAREGLGEHSAAVVAEGGGGRHGAADGWGLSSAVPVQGERRDAGRTSVGCRAERGSGHLNRGAMGGLVPKLIQPARRRRRRVHYTERPQHSSAQTNSKFLSAGGRAGPTLERVLEHI